MSNKKDKPLCKCGKQSLTMGLCHSCYNIDARKKKEALELSDKISQCKFSLKEYICESLIKIFKKPPNIPVWKWTEENIRLPNSEGFQGSQAPDWSIAPEMKTIFEDLENPDCREIFLVFSSQSSKTLFEICAMAYLNYKYKASIMFVMPSERLFKRLPRRLKSIYKISNVEYDDSKGQNSMDFITINNNVIEFALATSPDSLAEKPCQAGVMDEYDEVPPQPISPYHLLKSRMRTFKGRDKSIVASTPKKLEGNGGVMDLYNSSKRYVIEMKCPECKQWSVFNFEDIKWDKNAHYSTIRSESLAWAECPVNGCYIDDSKHDEMVLAQRWKCLDPGKTEEKKGYHKPVWCTMFENWSTTAAAYIEKKESGVESETDFWNSWAAQPKDLESKRLDVGELNIRSTEYKRGQIHKDCKCVTVGVDVGSEDAWLVMIGWAPKNVMYEFWSARIDIAGDDFDKIERAIVHAVVEKMDYLGDGPKPRVLAGCMDSGYNTEQVYDFCRRMPLWKPIKGNPNIHQPWTITPADPKRRYGDKSRGVMLYNLNSMYWQDSLHYSLTREMYESNSFNTPMDAHDRYITHLNNEHKKKFFDKKTNKEKEIWMPVYKKAPQHLRDATIYAIVAGHLIGANNLQTVFKEKEPIENSNRPTNRPRNRPQRRSNRL